MKFVQFRYKHDPEELRVGYMENEDVVDINKYDPRMPSTMVDILKEGCTCNAVTLKRSNPLVEPKSSVVLMAPITGIDKILGVHLNYVDLCEELNIEKPTLPVIYSKFASSIIGQNEPVKIRTGIVKEVDWEVQLAVVIGRDCSNVAAVNALKYVFGYTVAQGISSRDWEEKNMGQLLLGKSQDTFCPLGPWIITCDEVLDPHNVEIKCSVNGVEKQHSNTSKIIYKIPEIIQRISSVMTLLAGDVILTGTPGGIGANRQPPEFLKPGDVLRSEIQNIGSFEVRVERFRTVSIFV